ncbi:MAG: AIR synthase-related protein, partial [Candidatus Bathyarchaeota archaeon]|nr:AIR synthase-related protein [Candidatus Bathyarchaeota archaeon]
LAERLFGVPSTEELANLVIQQSCAKEALMLAQFSGVHAMHDATEGGVTAALNELAEASDVGFTVDWDSFVFPEQVYTLKQTYQLTDTQLLSMSSTGTFLVAVSEDAKETVESVLRQNGVEFSFLGRFTKTKSRVLVKNGKETQFPQQPDDPYSFLLSEKQ